MSSAKLIYFADVYCPWCYAFAPSIMRLHSEYRDIPVHVVGGSLIAQSASLREMQMREPGLGQFWRNVHDETGRPFTGILEDLANQTAVRMDSFGADALYMALAELAPGRELEQFTGMEDMFFAKGLDIFTEESMSELAAKYNISASELASLAADPAMRQRAMQEIHAVEEMLGESAAFPTVFLMRGRKGEFVSQGYVHYETVASRMADAMQDLDLEPLTPHEKMSLHK